MGLQCNHRSWADFFVDVLTTQGDSQMLSRCKNRPCV